MDSIIISNEELVISNDADYIGTIHCHSIFAVCKYRMTIRDNVMLSNAKHPLEADKSQRT